MMLTRNTFGGLYAAGQGLGYFCTTVSLVAGPLFLR